MFAWVFRSRETGEVTIAQVPNLPLAVFLIASLVRWIVGPSGTPGHAVNGVATGALALWAIDELVRGVNPWRRALGGAALAWQAWRLITR